MPTAALLACGLVAPPLFALTFLFEGASRAGYDPWRHAVSQLSLGEGGWVNVTALVLCGLMVLAFGFGLGRVYVAGIGSVWAPRLLKLFGLSLIAACIFPDDPSLGYPPGAPEIRTVPGLIHGLAGLILFGSLSAACFVVARRFAVEPGGNGWAWYSRLTGLCVPVAFIACTVLFTLDQAGVLSPALAGLMQRVSLISGLTWLTLLAARLLSARRVGA
ncbi:MAG TPA: DUF998 domain-containing protein [Limnochordia bacterium]